MSFIIGIIIGFILSYGIYHIVGNRYEISSGGPQNMIIIKVDKFSGKSWKFWNGEWQLIKQEN